MKKKVGRSAGPKRAASQNKKAEATGPQWAVLKGKELDWPGAPLLALLIEAANTRGMSSRELAVKHLGISNSHFLLLRKGQRGIARLSPETMTRIATFLKLPKVIVMLAGGQLKLEDFYQDPNLLEQQLESALQFIQRDPEIGPHMPPTAFVADIELRRFILMLYEKASGKSLIPSRTTIPEITEQFKTAAAANGDRD
jgi:hypothetical protein